MPQLVRATTVYIEMRIGGVWQRINYADIPGNPNSNAWITKIIKALQDLIDSKISWAELPIDDPARENDPGREDWFRDGTDLISREDIVLSAVMIDGVLNISQRRTRRN
jgi:hypothetical protein